MKLYGFPTSTNVWFVRAVAAHLEISLDFQIVDAFKGELRKPEFLQLNPSGRVPVLVDDDFVLWESNAIAQYLASQINDSLYPNDIKIRADIMRWQSWQMNHWRPGCQPLQYERLVKPMLQMGKPDTVVIEQALAIFHREASLLEQHLSNHNYLVNNDLTIADFSVASYLVYAQPAQIPVEKYPKIQDWLNSIISLPSWQTTAPQH
jgi:glutathione S-transferase